MEIKLNTNIIICILLLITGGVMFYQNKKDKKDKKEEFVSTPILKTSNLRNKSMLKIPQTIQGTTDIQPRSENGFDQRSNNVYWFDINSGDRDYINFPNANNFRFRFPYKIWNIKSIELLHASIPKGQYTIDFFNEWMDIRVANSLIVSVRVARGMYDINEYIDALNTSLTSAGINLVFTYITLTSSVSVQNTGTESYTLLYRSGEHVDNSNFNELGFPPDNILINTGQTVSSGRVNLFGADSINIELLDVHYNNNSNRLANIYLRENSINIYETPFLLSKRTLNPYISLNQLTVQVTFEQPFKTKKLYNFNNLDYSFTIEIITSDYTMPFLPKLHTDAFSINNNNNNYR